MSLDPVNFSIAYDGMASKFKQPENDFVKMAYYQGAIEAKFDDANWKLACEKAARSEKFLPTLDRLIELALGDRLLDQVQEDWRWAYYVLSGGDIVTALQRLTAPGRLAMESLGRPQDLGQQPEDYVKTTIRDKFFRAYRTYALRNGLGDPQFGIAIEGTEQQQGLRRLFDAQ